VAAGFMASLMAAREAGFCRRGWRGLSKEVAFDDF
jgi:hypothetical protein